jgi:hypothetical protein
VRTGRLLHPRLGDNLPSAPSASVQVQVADLRQIVREKVQVSPSMGASLRVGRPHHLRDTQGAEEMLASKNKGTVASLRREDG